MARRFCAALLAALLFPGGLPAQSPQQPETFSESLVVREREIVIDLPDNLTGDRLEPGDFRVLMDGEPRAVARAEPVSAADAPWTAIVYVDRVLASPGTVFYSTLSLSEHARSLTGLGTVEVVVADSDPVTALAPTREPLAVARTLAALSGEARVERDRAEARARPDAQPSAFEAHRQLAKLLAFLAARRPAGPHALFLVADSPELATPKGDGSPGPLAASLQETARLLSAYGWVTTAVSLRKEEIGRQHSMISDVDRIRLSAGAPGLPPVIPTHPPRTTLAFDGVIDVFIGPKTAALRTLSQPTTGTVVGFEEQIGPLLASLGLRWRLWLDEPDSPMDGRLHQIAVSVPGKRKQVRSQEWIRSSTPEEIAGARLENLLSGVHLEDNLPLTAAVARTPAGMELRIEVASLQLPESRPGPVRISWAFPGPESEEGATDVHHQILPRGDLEKGFRHTLRIEPPAGARKVAVVVEALGPERWAGRVLETGP
ncbi:MAG TPA: hypothetical protein VHC97_21305 [Thermoanaerobaculia bacterium]|jgi:hypothetical protein|nr:hypothetical protein [Thermoanaerobaculia bacterium]